MWGFFMRLINILLEDDYRGQHRAPTADAHNTLDDLSDIYPDDIYSSEGVRFYGDRTSADQESINVIHMAKGKPNKSVTVYRAVPYEKSPSEQLYDLETNMKAYKRRGNVPRSETNGLTGSEWYNDAWDRRSELEARVDAKGGSVDTLSINPGDWVTTSRRYAKSHGESTLRGKYKIVSKKVKANELATDGDSIHEWGWNPI
jgi:hypothetical protein